LVIDKVYNTDDSADRHFTFILCLLRTHLGHLPSALSVPARIVFDSWLQSRTILRRSLIADSEKRGQRSISVLDGRRNLSSVPRN
jgi:hypothetical protein